MSKMLATASEARPRTSRVVRVAWERVECYGAVVCHDAALPPTTLALYGYSGALGAPLIVLHARLRSLPVQEAEAILHELGHDRTISSIGVPDACSESYMVNVMSRAERAACQWAAEQAVPFEELQIAAGDLVDSYDVADYFECSHRFAQLALKIYRGPYLGKHGHVPDSLARLFARVERERA